MVKGEVENYDIRKDGPWSKITLVVLAILIIGLGYLINVVLQKQYREYKRRNAEWAMEQRLLKNSSCKRITKGEFHEQAKIVTKKELQKLFGSEDYQQYMRGREDLVVPPINGQLEYHTDSDHDQLL